ncbi:hypothetical protein [Piscirickettsia salmonis]|uniref:hypothetical protein n=1 Tax=Piscirickettsia salmonis TaxID=1238 RepID=UPI0007C9572D|nr:hypothetical protein A0O36_02192 [Piscirickettsiaceae bacterium NZ-RLO1]
MPRIKPITKDSGAIAHSYQSHLLTTGGNYGDPLLGNVAIIAESKKGYGLFHATGMFASSENFTQWLKDLKEILGNRIRFRVIDPKDNQARLYFDDLEKECLKQGIQPTTVTSTELETHQPIAVSREGVILGQESLLENSQKPSVSEPTLQLYEKTDLRDLITSINRKLELAVEGLQEKVEKSGFFSKKKEKIDSRKELLSLQKILDLLAPSSYQNLTQKSLKTVEMQVNALKEKLKDSKLDTIQKLLEELRKDFEQYNSAEIWNRGISPAADSNDQASAQETSIYSDIKLSGPTPPPYSRQHSDGPEVHYSAIDFKNKPGFTHTSQEEEIFGTIGAFQPRPQGASGHSSQSAADETSFQQQSSTSKALPKDPIDPSAIYATIDLTKKHADRAQKQQQDLQPSTLFQQRQNDQANQSADQGLNYGLKK